MSILVNLEEVKQKMLRYGFHASDMTIHEFVEDELTPVITSNNDWISTKDKLPKGGQRVLACTKYGDVLEMLYTIQSHRWFVNGQLYDSETVTYWMPIPQPPKEV